MTTLTLSHFTDTTDRLVYQVLSDGSPLMAATPHKRDALAVLHRARSLYRPGEKVEVREWDGDTGEERELKL